MTAIFRAIDSMPLQLLRRQVQVAGTHAVSRSLSDVVRYRLHHSRTETFTFEEPMAAKSTTKAKSKTRPASKTKAKRAGTKPLLARSAEVRRAKPAPRRRATANVPVASVGNPAFAMFGMTARVMQAYAEFPFRLAQCRTPMDVWLEQMRFARRIFS
jgi:hypothetical protein